MPRKRDWLDDFEDGLKAASRLTPKQEAAVAAEWAKKNAPAPVRPLPAAGQVWSAASPKGRRFIAIVGVEPTSAEAIEVTGDGHPVTDNVLKGRALRTALDTGELAPSYRFEPTITAIDTTPDEGTNRAPRTRKETAVSTNHTETLPTPKPAAKKVPNLKSPRPTVEAAADRITKKGIEDDNLATPTTVTVPKKLAKRLATLKANPTPENIENVLLGGPVKAAKKAATKAAAPAPKKAPAPKPKARVKAATPATGGRWTDEQIEAFMAKALKADPDTTRSAAIKEYREAGHPGGEIRLRVLFDKVLAGQKKASKK